jgi:hypothetical protein
MEKLDADAKQTELALMWENIKQDLNMIDVEVKKSTFGVRASYNRINPVMKRVIKSMGELILGVRQQIQDGKTARKEKRIIQSQRTYNFDPDTYVRKEEINASK